MPHAKTRVQKNANMVNFARMRRAEIVHDEIKNRSFCIYDRLLQIIIRNNPAMDLIINERDVIHCGS